MKASNTFTKVISAHLDEVASKDPLFAETLKKPNKNITDCTNYILNEVKKSGRNGFADEEIFGMAIHYYDEDDIKKPAAVGGRVVVNRSIKSTRSSTEGKVAAKKSKKASPMDSQPANQISMFQL